MRTIPSNGTESHKSGSRFSGSIAGKFLFTALAAILLAQTSLASDVAGTARLIRERRGHTATAIGGGKILVAGGQNLSGALADAETFDAMTGTFTVAARLLTPRAEHTATRLADGRVFLIGGRGTETLASTEFFDPSRNVFSSGPSLNSPRFGHTATLLPDGRVVVIGGNAAGTAEIFDPSAGTFAALPCHLSETRSFHAAVRLRDGSILIAGGISRDGGTLKSAEILHPDTLECERIATPMFAARSRFTLRMLPDGKVQAIGGDAERTMELFNPNGYFSSLAHLAGTAGSESAALRNPGRVAIIGPSARPISDSPASLGGREVVRPVQGLLDRIDYSLTELPEAGVAIAAGGVSSTGRYQQTAVLFDASTATVTTDQTDYHPGETVTITGTGWLPGETVTLNLHRDTNDPPDTVLTAVADVNGNITNSEYVCQEFDLGITFLLTATGQTSGYTAQTTFTDGNLSKLELVPASVTVTQGDGAVYAANVKMAGNDNQCTITLSVTTVLPTGAVATFSLPNPTILNPGNTNFSRTLTISTTQLTPAGNYAFTARATEGPDCQNPSFEDAPGTLIVTAASGACAGQASGFVCRADAGQCDVAETCNGVSPLCPADSFEPITTSCTGTSQAGACDNDAADHCTGTSNSCVDAFEEATFICRADAGQCDVAESCTGTSGACPADSFEPATASCTGASQGGVCDNDTADRCTGTSNACVDAFQEATFTCRGSAGQCDVAESCTGSAGACPSDAFAATTVACTGTSQGGVCDNDAGDRCTGTNATSCNDAFKPSTFECRGSAGQCDVAESCTGSAGACPADAFAATTVACTGASQGGLCDNDAGDRCTGASATACNDAFQTPATECRASGGQCDVAESCTGSSGACPADAFAAATVACTGASQGGLCDNDAGDHCAGTDATSCNDAFKPSTFECRGSAGQCDVAESCTGSSGACPADAFAAATVACTGASQGGLCDNDAGDHCAGTDATSCNDAFKPSTFECRGAAGVCDQAETCTGSGGACPTDSKVPGGTQCRGSAGECDVAETCNGSTNDCPNDGFQPTGTSCSSDDEVCTTDQCGGASAMCGHTRIPNCGSDCSTNTPPFVTTTSGSPSAPIALGGSVQVTANFTDASLFQTHTCTINWDDGGLPEDGVITEPSGTTPGSCTGFHAYSAPGVYTVAFVINDGCSTGLGKYEFVVVYDPSGGFVTGGGWINSPLGAYLADPSLVGKANFGFVSKYKKGSNVPDGETEFQFKAGDLNFHSSGYDLGSLVVSGYKAQYRGSGTINGVSGYKFVLTAYDGQAPSGGGTDRFRIKILRIVDSSVVYDNKMGSSEDIDVVPTALAGGSIVIHK